MLRSVSESFIDLSYRGLSIGERIRLSQVRPSSGYVESPAPMPVGTTIALTTDEGVTLEARVAGVHEQVGGSTQPPGMHIRPTLTEDKASLWWQARVTLPDDPALRERAPEKSITTVRPRSKTIPNPVPEAPKAEPAPTVMASPPPAPTIPDAAPTLREASSPFPAAESDPQPLIPAPPVLPQQEAAKTVVMSAVDQETLAKLTRNEPSDTEPPPVADAGPLEQSNGAPLPPVSGEHPIVDDDQRTTVMDAVDISALGLGIEVSASGSMSMVHDDDLPDDPGDSGPMPVAGSESGPTSSGDKKPKKRRKRR
jgi:hypothetical protein